MTRLPCEELGKPWTDTCIFKNLPILCKSCKVETFDKDGTTLLGTHYRNFVVEGCECEVIIAEPPTPKKNLYERCVLGRIKP